MFSLENFPSKSLIRVFSLQRMNSNELPECVKYTQNYRMRVYHRAYIITPQMKITAVWIVPEVVNNFKM